MIFIRETALFKEHAIKNVESHIEQTEDKIMSTVSSKYVTYDEFDESNKRIEAWKTERQQDDKSFRDTIESRVGDSESTLKTITDTLKFAENDDGDPTLSIETSENQFKMELTNKDLTFSSGDTEIAKLDGEHSSMSVKQINIGKYAWAPTNDGNNLTLVYIG